MNKYFALLLIYIGTWFYTFASFYHLKLKQWTFSKAYLIAIPLVLLEYIFNLIGNKHATLGGLNAIQIMTCIIGFYMLNIWIFNMFVLKQKNVNVFREGFAILLLIGAIAISSNMLSYHARPF